jgi:hypothetical protein
LPNGYRITFLGVAYNTAGSDTSVWTYRVEELAGAQDLSNWVLELAGCTVMTAEPEPWEVVNPDPNARLNGIKWQTGAGFVRGEFSVTLLGTPAAGPVLVAAKGPDVERGVIAGPLCGGGTVDDEEDEEPPAVIVITPPTPDEAPTVVIENNVTYVVTVITISNTGGDGRGVFLVIDLDDLIELADLRFLESQGYIVEIRGRQVVIGLGLNNIVKHDEKVRLQLKFKSKGDGRSEVRTTIRYAVRTSAGTSEPVVLNVVIPVVVVVAPAPVVVARLALERIDVRFRGRWERDGGLRVFGLPLSEPVTLRTGIIVQYFERARFELHPGGQVLLGLLGVELVGLQPPLPPPTSTTTLSATLYFVPTGHYVAPVFIEYWRTRGGLLLFGYPIGEAYVDASGRLVQYFERARFEYHPNEDDVSYRVQLGFLGEEVLVRRGGRVGDD